MADIAPERLLMRNLISSTCGKYPAWTESLSDEKRTQFATEMERSCFNDAVISCIQDGIDRWFTNLPFVGRYSANCYKLIANLDPQSSVASDYLITQIIDGKIDPTQIVSMTSYELCPCASQREHDEIELRMSQHIEEKVSRRYRCPKCKENRTIPHEYPGRAADEAACHSIECITCGYKWRM